MWLAQKGLCGCGCGEKLKSGPRATIAEHTAPVALGNDAKPDHIRNRACAKLKTHGGRAGDRWAPVGGDIRDIAHIKRLAENRTQADKRPTKRNRLTGRPFPKGKKPWPSRHLGSRKPAP